MTRIIAGTARGRRLAVPPGRSTRPTSDRAREGLFATVLAVLGTLGGASVLDLYAGSGAVGLEALSRGAGDVLLVESDPAAASTIRANITAVGLPGARLLTERADRAIARGPGHQRPRDFVFADPPYAASDEEVGRLLGALQDGGWLAAAALLAVERGRRSGPPPWPPGVRADRCRSYGESALWYGRAAGSEPADSPAGE